MKIDSYSIGMESARNYKVSKTGSTGFRVKENKGQPEKDSFVLSTAINTVNVRERYYSSSSLYEDFRQQMIRYIFNMLFAFRKERVHQWSYEENREMTEYNAVAVQNANSAQSVKSAQNADFARTANSGQIDVTLISDSVWIGNHGFGFTQKSYYEEQEEVAFRARGIVKTSNGRKIDFGMQIQMSREFREYSEERLELKSLNLCDPLVINLDLPVAKLEDQSFYFDLDADGELDNISNLSAGSGYLALDKNKDGIINDGSELFGTQSGNGFADLAKYDQDGNGWIDENDEIWDRLKIWTKDENGKDVLYRLAEKGVGAICLRNVSTDFTMKESQGLTTGVIRNTGIFLFENGNVGTIQHVDLAKK